jgi:hypothetical protein
MKPLNIKIQTEIQRITNTLDDLIEELEVLNALPTHYTTIPAHTLKKLSEPAKTALLQLYDEEKILKNKMEEKKQNDIQEWMKKVKKSTVKICQLLKKERFSEYTVSDESENTKLLRLVRLMEEMREVWVEKLNTTEEEKQTQNEQKKDTAAREKKANADRKALERELAAEKSSREKELSIREDSLKKLQTDLKALLEDTNSQKSQYNDKIDAKEKLAQAKFNKFNILITERIKRTKLLLHEMKQANLERENEFKLHRKNVEKQVEDIVQEYDSYMSKTTYRVNQLMKEHKEDNIRIEFLQEELKKCAADKQLKEEENKKINDEKQKVLDLRRKRVEAANRIGRFYKNVLIKREEAKKAAKKKRSKSRGKSKSPAKRGATTTKRR